MHYRNDDPPDYPEPPECCGDEMEVFYDGVCLCPTCGLRVAPVSYADPESMEELPEFCYNEDGRLRCPHGNAPGPCDLCDYLSDIAFDAARERL